MFLAPRQLPPLEVLLADIGQPAPAVIGRALGVHERTVYAWQSRGEAPRAAALALFWETRWGRSVNEAQAVNGERWARGQVQALEREKATLLARVAYLERVGQFGAANAPTLSAPVTFWRSDPAACA
jgi:hypothetical protein